MDNTNENYNKKDTGNLKIVITILLLVVLLLGEVYFMLNDPTNYIVLIVLTVVILADVYMLVASAIQQNYKRELDRYEQYDNLFKSEKASYLILRKSFEEISERLDRIEDASGLPVDEIINAQKSIAKVSINRNKENTDALMNSNDKMIERIFALEDQLDNNNAELLSKQQTVIENANKDLIMKQQEMIGSLRELELSIKNEILSAANRVNVAPQVVMSSSTGTQSNVSAQPQEEFQSNTFTKPMEELYSNTSTQSTEELQPEMAGLMNKDVVEEKVTLAKEEALKEDALDFTAEDDSFAEEEEVSELPLEMFAKTLASQEQEGSAQQEKIGAEDELPDLDALFASEELQNTENMEELPIIDDNFESDIPEAVEEPIIGEEPVIEKPASSIADANRIMTPEEIAALIAGTNDVEEPVIAEEPMMEKSVVEESPTPIVATSAPAADPNRMMTPDEIAALFANA